MIYQWVLQQAILDMVRQIKNRSKPWDPDQTKCCINVEN
jgi:hypothetical protein